MGDFQSEYVEEEAEQEQEQEPEQEQEEQEEEEEEEKMYVAVSKDMKQNKSLLTWALQNSGGKKLCAIHVHEVTYLSFDAYGDPFVEEYDAIEGVDPLYYHPTALKNRGLARKKEQEEMSDALDECLRISQKSQVHIEKLYVEAVSVKQGIIQLVHQHGIGKLVIGAGAVKLFSRNMKVRSKKAVYLRDNAPSFCHICFICKGHLIYTREAKTPVSSPGKNAPDDLFPSCWSINSNDDSALRSGSVREFSAGRISQFSSTFMSGSEPESSVTDHTYHKFEHDLMEAENSRSLDFGESLRRLIAENKALTGAVCKAETAERLFKEELKLREAKEEELAKVKDILNKTSNELQMIIAQKFSLENLLEKSNLSLEESETKLFSAVELLNKYKNEHGKFQKKMINALEEADKLRKQLAEGPSSSNLPHFFSVFSLSDLEKATNNFDPLLKIGEGGYGNIYKGFLRHTEVAIKILHHNSTQGPREFIQEVDVLSKLRHPNLVILVGACPESWALVYEYLPGGNLEDRLNCKDNALPLPWQTRIQIATELCSALIFLHSSLPGCVIHGDLKPSNVLLGENCVCKLSDFGICRVASNGRTSMDQTTLIFTNELKGTIMYMDPEFLSTGELTRKSDVYSFGIILLRLLTGKSALGIARDVVSALSKGSLGSMLDPSAGDWPFVQAEQLARMALRCCDMSRKNRPDLGSDVWKVLAPMKSSCQSLSVLRLVSNNQAPNYFICPIFQEIMKDPHIASDGFTYEAEAIRGWLNGGHDSSPMTNMTFENHNLTPNLALRSAIQEWLQHNQSV